VRDDWEVSFGQATRVAENFGFQAVWGERIDRHWSHFSAMFEGKSGAKPVAELSEMC